MGLPAKISPFARFLMFWKILRDPKVPRWAKAGFVVASLVYLISPIDLIPDLVPVVTWIDDLVMVPVFAWLFGWLMPGSARRWRERGVPRPEAPRKPPRKAKHQPNPRKPINPRRC